jgi:ABC-type Na+ efflux pump permease subunit
MPRRLGRLTAVLAVGLLAMVAAVSAAGRIGIDLPGSSSSIDSELPSPRLAPGTAPTRVKPEPAKHGRTAPLLPAAALVAAVVLLLYGFGIAGAPSVLGRLARSSAGNRSTRAPPALLSV